MRSASAAVAQQLVVLAHERHGRGAGDRLDAADVRGARALADDPEEPDLGGRAHVRAAAQLAREAAVADLDHPHDVAVLLAEQRHRAERLGLVERRRDRPHRQALEDPRVDLVLDVAAVLLAELRGVGEVEAQLVGADVRAGLADVVAEPLAQRRVQQVRRGVVAGRRVARRAVDLRDDALARAQLALDRAHDQRLVVAGAHDVDDLDVAVAVLAGDRALVAHLAAALGVERGLGELDEHAPVVLGRDALHDGVDLEVLVADERRRARSRARARSPPRARPCRPWPPRSCARAARPSGARTRRPARTARRARRRSRASARSGSRRCRAA